MDQHDNHMEIPKFDKSISFIPSVKALIFFFVFVIVIVIFESLLVEKHQKKIGLALSLAAVTILFTADISKLKTIVYFILFCIDNREHFFSMEDLEEDDVGIRSL